MRVLTATSVKALSNEVGAPYDSAHWDNRGASFSQGGSFSNSGLYGDRRMLSGMDGEAKLKTIFRDFVRRGFSFSFWKHYAECSICAAYWYIIWIIADYLENYLGYAVHAAYFAAIC
jgi:hypothetical protein